MNKATLIRSALYPAILAGLTACSGSSSDNTQTTSAEPNIVQATDYACYEGDW